jgi:hypothetical protein
MNIVDLVKSQLGSDVLGPLGNVLGTTGQETRGAVDAAVPALLAGLSHLAGTNEGARKITSAVNSADEGVVGNITHALSAGNSGGFSRRFNRAAECSARCSAETCYRALEAC